MRLSNLVSKIVAPVAAVAAAVVSSSASAADAAADLSTLTSAVSFAPVATAVIAIAGTLIVLYVTIKGAKTVISMVRGG